MLLDTLHEDATAGSHPICLPNGDCGRKEEVEGEEKEGEEVEGEEGMEMGETCSEGEKPSNDAKLTTNGMKKSATKNSSVITDTFQGMLRNEVCIHVVASYYDIVCMYWYMMCGCQLYTVYMYKYDIVCTLYLLCTVNTVYCL